jgi:FixJ family two-component response regulator
VTISPPCIAVVDDDASVCTMLRRVLRLDGYRVTLFSSGDALLAALSAQMPACVVLDVHMPRLSGFGVLSRLRETGAEAPAIFITASDDRSLDQSVAEAGGIALLRKPFTSHDLLAAVRDALQGR